MRHIPTRIIGLVGLPGAGKTTIAKYLEKKRFTHVILSDFIKVEASKSGIVDFTREILQDYGNKMREQFGPQILAQLALKKIRSDKITKVVIDGVRNPYEVAFLKVENNFTLIGVAARPQVRYKRLVERKTRSWNGSFHEFLKQEHREESLGSAQIGLRVSQCLKEADYIIQNNSSIDSLYKATEAVLLLKKSTQ